jgi:hypothetical protein
MNPILLLSNLFRQSLENNTLLEHFSLVGHGSNGVVLRHNDREFALYCIKTVMNDFLKETVMELYKEDSNIDSDYLEYLENNLGINKNLHIEVENYRKIGSFQSLKKYIPELFFPLQIQEKTEYIILEFVEGDYFNFELTKTIDHNLRLVINEFKKNGFEFGDKIEGITKKDGSIVLIDLDSIQRNT